MRILHTRRDPRLHGFDYSTPASYLVTAVVTHRACLLGNESDTRLNDAGRMVEECWKDLPARFSGVELDAFVVMPNHLHGIVVLTRTSADSRITLGAVMGAFKSLTTLGYSKGVHGQGWPPFNMRLWQRNYYDHVIRGPTQLSRLRRYIRENPAAWHIDKNHPANFEGDHKGRRYGI